MSSSRNTRFRSSAGLAAGALALAAVSVLPTPAQAAAPAAGVSTAGAVSTAATVATTGRKAATRNRLMVVRTEKQLRRAVQKANRRDGTDRIRIVRTITFSDNGGTRGGALFGDLDVVDDLRINGAGVRLDAAGVSRHFDVREGAELVVRNLAMVGGRVGAGQSGGAVRNQGTTILRNVRLLDNEVVGEGASGGAAVNDGGLLVLERSWAVGNSAVRAGGAVEAVGGRTVLRKTRLSRNETGAAPGNGGGLHLTGAGRVYVSGSVIADNTASAEGGGLWNSAEGTMLVTRSWVRGNTASGAEADQGGGGVYNDGGTLRVRDTRVLGNTAAGAAGSGGGLLTVAGDVVVERGAISRNTAARAGGGVEVVEGDVSVVGSRLAGNSTGQAPGNGGALHVTGSTADVTVAGSVVVGNEASSEGGGLWNNGGTMTVRGSDVIGNTALGDDADNGGGGLFQNPGGTMTVVRSTVSGNTATGTSGSGGGILVVGGGTVELRKSTVADNTAVRAGGGIEVNASRLVVVDSDATGNDAGDNPGYGGGLHVTGGSTVDWTGGAITGNTAMQGGGVWNSDTGVITLTDVDVSGNDAGGDDDDLHTEGGPINQG